MVFLAREFPWEGKEIYQTPLPTMSQQECLLKATFLHHLEKSKFKNLFLTIIIFLSMVKIYRCLLVVRNKFKIY